MLALFRSISVVEAGEEEVSVQGDGEVLLDMAESERMTRYENLGRSFCIAVYSSSDIYEVFPSVICASNTEQVK